MSVRAHAALAAVLLTLAAAAPSRAQAVSQRGFVELRGTFFPQTAPNDSTQAIADLLAREDVFADVAPWLQVNAGVELRANSHDQVDASWRVDYGDRGRLRPAIAIRRLGVTVARGPFTIDAGKQFVRWGTTDIVTPTDRFAPRDFLEVVNTDFLAITAVRAVAVHGADSLDAVWAPRFTPSRTPLADQRWTIVPPDLQGVLHDVDRPLPTRDQFGVRWSHLGEGYEFAAAYFDGFNHLPDYEAVGPAPGGVARSYPRLRLFGGDAALPTRWFTLKGEAAYFMSPDDATDEYVLYVAQLERQSGEWVFVGGYAGEAVTQPRGAVSFSPDRGLTRSIVARASYTIDANRSVSMEGALRQDGDGAYVKGEYSEARGQHWRVTLAGVLIRGAEGAFLGQYHRNSHGALTLRYSF